MYKGGARGEGRQRGNIKITGRWEEGRERRGGEEGEGV